MIMIIIIIIKIIIIIIIIIIVIIIIIIQCIYRASFPYSSKTPNDLLCLFSEARSLPFCEATLKKVCTCAHFGRELS